MGVYLHNHIIHNSNERGNTKAPAKSIQPVKIELKSNEEVLRWPKSVEGTLQRWSVT